MQNHTQRAYFYNYCRQGQILEPNKSQNIKSFGGRWEKAILQYYTDKSKIAPVETAIFQGKLLILLRANMHNLEDKNSAYQPRSLKPMKISWLTTECLTSYSHCTFGAFRINNPSAQGGKNHIPINPCQVTFKSTLQSPILYHCTINKFKMSTQAF